MRADWRRDGRNAGGLRRGNYDLAGFAVGAAERGRILTGAGVAEGDVILGLESSGVHSNGFSLVRRVIERAGLTLADPALFAPTQSLGEALLTPTRIYVRSCLAAIATGGVRALAHITGGGLVDNIPRVLPLGLGCELDTDAWPDPPVFAWLAREGNIPWTEMVRTFNCGLGMIVIATAKHAREVVAALEEAGENVHVVGRIVTQGGAPAPRVALVGAEDRW